MFVIKILLFDWLMNGYYLLRNNTLDSLYFNLNVLPNTRKIYIISENFIIYSNLITFSSFLYLLNIYIEFKTIINNNNTIF